MRTNIGCVAVLLGMMGIVTEAAAVESNANLAEKRGLSPIVVAQAEAKTSAPSMTLGNCEDVQTPDNPDGQLGGGYLLLLHYKIIGITNLKKCFQFRMPK